MADEDDDIGNYVARWKESPTPFQSSEPERSQYPASAPDDVWLEAESGEVGQQPADNAVTPQGPTGPGGAGPTGPRGSRGSRGSTGGSRGSRGSRGSQGSRGSIGLGSRGSKGTRGSAGSRGSRGSMGSKGDMGSRGSASSVPGPPGRTGPTGPKSSVIRTELGNIVFSCLEGARPWVFDIYRLHGGETVCLRQKFVASTAPGSLFPQSVVQVGGKPVAISVELEGDILRAYGSPEAEVIVTVYGKHLHFPDDLWDLREVSEDVRARSVKWWNNEWSN